MFDLLLEAPDQVPLFLGWIPAAIGAVGAIAGGLLASRGASQRNDDSIALSQEQMAWQERMQNTAYQRAMGDMKAAGLNPILAYQQGGAGTGSYQLPTLENEFGGATDAVNSAMKGAMVKAELDQIEAHTEKLETDAKLNTQLEKKAEWDTDVSAAEWEKKNVERDVLNQQVLLTAQDYLKRKEETPTAASEARLKALEADRSSQYGESILGKNLQSLERMIERLFKFLK